MSSDMAIRVENLCKCYQIYEKPRDRLLQMLFQGHRQFYREFWALKDVSFEVKKGETVGIIGRNGCGKSTLLQMICGILNPTTGTIQTNGRIAALLELGSGFNPEFTGRENVYMNASVLGLMKNEIDARFAEIVAFADIGSFIDRPVKTYSSGMVVRLAFAVASNADPQILVVDEALAVGDELFQRKCYSRINQIKKNGATILFVSHSGGTIVSLCDCAILLEAGEKIAEGLPKDIVGLYQKMLYAPPQKLQEIRDQICGREASKIPTNHHEPQIIQQKFFEEEYNPHLKPSSTIVYESRGAVIDRVRILTEMGRQVNNLIHGRWYIYEYFATFDVNIRSVRFGMLIKTITGIELGGAVSAPTTDSGIPLVEAGTSYRVRFRFNASLNVGTFFMNAGVVGQVDGKECYVHRLIDITMFKIVQDKTRTVSGIVDFGCIPDVQLVSS